MASFVEGVVASIEEETGDLLRALVTVDGSEIESIGYPRMLGPLEPGDSVILNTTGLELGLGTGGVAFILWNLDAPEPVRRGEGHIVKMNYTPWQTEVFATESPENPLQGLVASADSVRGMPVVACGLHSQIAAVAAGIKAAMPESRVGYMMTDGAALPIAWSKLVRSLQAVQLIDVTCTTGHAFGGRLESVNAFSGLVALRWAGEADVAIAAPGPGVIGTGTTLGFSSIEQGQLLDAATALGGQSVASLRISFDDERERHTGISHHTLTSLRVAARERATVAVPDLPGERGELVRTQLESHGVAEKHDLVTAEGGDGLRLLGRHGLDPSSMGRRMSESPEPFLAGAAAGAVAATLM